MSRNLECQQAYPNTSETTTTTVAFTRDETKIASLFFTNLEERKDELCASAIGRPRRIGEAIKWAFVTPVLNEGFSCKNGKGDDEHVDWCAELKPGLNKAASYTLEDFEPESVKNAWDRFNTNSTRYATNNYECEGKLKLTPAFKELVNKTKRDEERWQKNTNFWASCVA